LAATEEAFCPSGQGWSTAHYFNLICEETEWTYEQVTQAFLHLKLGVKLDEQWLCDRAGKLTRQA
jgi:hypothetical protein